MKYDLTGKTFNFWTVLERLFNKGRTQYLCKCICGVIKTVQTSHLKSGMSKSCGCQKLFGAKHPSWTGFGEISGDVLYNIKKNAEGRKHSKTKRNQRPPVDFNLTAEYLWNLFLSQNRKCALTGIEITLPRVGKSDRTASLDRIDYLGGYIEGNVQWVHKDINRMKNIYSQEYFIIMCNAVTKQHMRL